MTKREYQELVEFLAPRFDGMNKRFDAVDERLSRVEILGEENRHQIQVVAEAVSDTVSNATFEAFRSEVAAGFADLRELLRASHIELDRRVTRLEEGRRRVSGRAQEPRWGQGWARHDGGVVLLERVPKARRKAVIICLLKAYRKARAAWRDGAGLDGNEPDNDMHEERVA